MSKFKRIVVKIGSSTLATRKGRIDRAFLAAFVEEIAAIHEKKIDIALVSSGAVRTGVEALGLQNRNLSIPQKQAAAAVGQGMLIARYARLFAKSGIIAAQALITRDVMIDRKKYLNARNTLQQLLSMRAVPIINENDTVSVEELKFGDNDTLSAQTAILTNADALFILSDVDGLYDRNPKKGGDARLIQKVGAIDDHIRSIAEGPLTKSASGGMITKIDAAQMCAGAGIPMAIVNGRTERAVSRLLAGEKLGTWFEAKGPGMSERKKWIAFSLDPEGALQVNQGAAQMLSKGGKSLLPSGIIAVKGEFEAGACVEIKDEEGRVFARGLAAYGAQDLRKLMGAHSSRIEELIGFRMGDEAVHRDNMAMSTLVRNGR